MKKILSIAVATLSVVALADQFSPQIGVTSLTLSEKNNIIPVQFKSLAGEGAITPDALVCTNNIPINTYLYVFVNNGYKAWYLTDQGWVSPSTVGTGVPAGEITYSGDATGTTVPVGSAIWISFESKPSLAKQIAVYGRVSDVTNTVIATGASDAPISSLVCNPSSSTITGEQLAAKLSSMTVAPVKGDKITLVGGDEFSGYYSYSTTKGWRYVNGSTVTDGLPDLGPNQGFWYQSKGGGGTITW